MSGDRGENAEKVEVGGVLGVTKEPKYTRK
jgi:hypothetical protein